MSDRHKSLQDVRDDSVTTLVNEEAGAAPASRAGQAPADARSWWQGPHAAWLAVAAAALLLIARKPWSLTTPQLWAEDGPVHLGQNDELGAAAFFMPYRGYLHLLPRLIAWTASHAVDVAYWPLFYNAAAFLVAVGLFARLASRRLDLPGKPWLVLSFVLAAHTGEVWFNITNLHWLTSFFLLLQILIARPTTMAQRLGDAAIVAVIGLTGPFVVVFLPLFVWRWWRERHADNTTVLVTAAACAAVQVYFINAASYHLPPQARPLNIELLLAVAGSRFVVWPFFGRHAAQTLAWPVLGAVGVTFVFILLSWIQRPDPRRRLRGPIGVAFVTIAGVCLWRIRPDTWAYPDLVNGDSYFYIGRILLVWLLIWEFDARPRVVAWTARGLCVLGVLLQLPRYAIPTPPDYHWAEHCDAIRRGEPAKIPTLPEGHTFDYHGRPEGVRLPVPWFKPGLPRNPGRLVNVSVLTRVTAAESSFTIGVVLGGRGTEGEKPLIIRAVGPSLAPLGLTDILPDPELAVLAGQAQVAANDNWASGKAEALSAAFARVGAFKFVAPTSRDAAVAFSPTIHPPASYTIQVGSHDATGTVLAELYDATPPAAYTRTTPRVINFSVLKDVPAGDVLTVGFTVGGETSRRVLVRAIGPTLAAGFGLARPLPDPAIALYDSQQKLVTMNNDWSGDTKLAKAFASTGAFTLPADSKDAAVLALLPPGSYSAQVTGAHAAAGTVLVEIYDVP